MTLILTTIVFGGFPRRLRSPGLRRTTKWYITPSFSIMPDIKVASNWCLRSLKAMGLTHLVFPFFIIYFSCWYCSYPFPISLLSYFSFIFWRSQSSLSSFPHQCYSVNGNLCKGNSSPRYNFLCNGLWKDKREMAKKEREQRKRKKEVGEGR